MSVSRMADYEACIAAIVANDPLFAFTSVPSGATAYFGESLGWPDWLLEGTGIAAGQNLPRQLRLVDGLRIFANLMVHLGEVRMGALMVNWPRFPGEVEALAAPDLEAALVLLVERVGQRNPTIRVRLERDREAATIRLAVAPELGLFRPIYELSLIIWLFLVLRSFLGTSERGLNLLSTITLGTLHADQAIFNILPWRARDVSEEAVVVIPEPALTFPSVDFDPDLWAGVVGVSSIARTRRLTNPSPSFHAIEKLVMQALRQQERVPQLAEIAHSLDRSERTLARALADGGTSYREIIDLVRMGMAEDLLLNSDTSVREVSARLGYSDDTAFVRAFRRCFGISPARWRKEHSG